MVPTRCGNIDIDASYTLRTCKQEENLENTSQTPKGPNFNPDPKVNLNLNSNINLYLQSYQ
eukprot:1875893-Amphidinium_carterae.1